MIWEAKLVRLRDLLGWFLMVTQEVLAEPRTGARIQLDCTRAMRDWKWLTARTVKQETVLFSRKAYSLMI